MNQNRTFKTHLTTVKNECKRWQNWLLGTFENCSVGFLRFQYKTFISSHLDFGSQIWSPIKYSEFDALDSIVRVWSRKCPAIRDCHFWDRLRIWHLSSVQRRHNRYIIIYCWKILEGLMTNDVRIKARWKYYKGKMISIPTPWGRAALRSLRKTSFSVMGLRWFNFSPITVPKFGGPGSSLEGFKFVLSKYLDIYTGRSRDMVSRKWPVPSDLVTGSQSKSLIHWRTYLQKNHPDYEWL